MIAARIYLAVIGITYLGLGVWCSLNPAAIAPSVGFELVGDTGRSEFFTVYGGLEFAIGLLFLMPVVFKQSTLHALQSCLVIHICLVVWRSVGFIFWHDVSRMLIQLAVFEWCFLLVTGCFAVAGRGESTDPADSNDALAESSP